MQNNTDFTIRELTKDEIIEIYQTIAPLHFPKEELRPLFNIQNIMKRNGYRGLGLFRQKTVITKTAGVTATTDTFSVLSALAGYAFFISKPDADVMLLDYFAILEEYRSQGLGGMFLQKMRASMKIQSSMDFAENTTENCSKNIAGKLAGILIETEDIACATTDEEKSLRKRRNDFYVHNGAVPTGLHDTLGTVPYEIFFLPTDTASSLIDFRSCLESLYRFMLEDETGLAYEKIVKWR